MNALLLAAGYGTRLRPVTDTVPKCLVPIQNKPLLAYWLELLLPHHCQHIVINTHYLADKVTAFIQNSPWQNAISLVHETTLLGTAGTVYNNRDVLKDGAFLLAHADNLTRFNMQDFMLAHAKRPSGVEITMMTFHTDNPRSCGIVELDEQNIVIGFHEKSLADHGHHANAAVYIMEPSVIDFLASLDNDVIDMSTEVLPHYLGRMQAYHNADYHRDIGTVESLQMAELEY
jgi:mannose-1-phosphate guanylyltransferase